MSCYRQDKQICFPLFGLCHCYHDGNKWHNFCLTWMDMVYRAYIYFGNTCTNSMFFWKYCRHVIAGWQKTLKSWGFLKLQNLRFISPEIIASTWGNNRDKKKEFRLWTEISHAWYCEHLYEDNTGWTVTRHQCCRRSPTHEALPHYESKDSSTDLFYCGCMGAGNLFKNTYPGQ